MTPCKDAVSLVCNADSSLRIRMLVSVSMVAIGATLASAARAQTTPPQASQSPAVEEIVVTGSRIVRNGYEAPTPLTVISEEAIQAQAPENLADYVNQLPSVIGSSRPQNTGVGVSGGTGGINALNLRGLGTVRTLVLLDGQRSVGAALTGIVDVSDFPQELVSRVDVVTGGASAAYGSDAVAGVVNFILDKKFVGLKGSVEGGVSTYGDDRSWKINLTGGTGFSNDRGHFLFSGEWADKDGIPNVPRDWNKQGWQVMTNPTYTATSGQPQRLFLPMVSLDNATLGGIITNTALKGIQFGPGGIPSQFNYGSLTSDPWTAGGDWKSTLVNDLSLDPAQRRQSVFTRLSYDVSDNVSLFAQFSWANSHTFYNSALQFNLANIIIKSDNAFIPSSVAAQLAASKITQFTLGTNNIDLPRVNGNNARRVNRYVVGGDGKFDAFDSSWSWDAYYQRGETRTSERVGNVTRKDAFGFAVDAVRASNGTIICRSTLTNPANECVPYDSMGIGVNSQAAINYLEDTAYRGQKITEDVAAASARGEPFSDWAGPISLATGLEWRREGVAGIVDANSARNNLFAGNFLPSFGSFSVTEGFVETVVPLAKETPWAKSLDLNAAVRATSYSISGYVTTWKVGATWQIIDDLRLRATRSRDIRAPNLMDLFNAGGANTSTVTDPFNGGVSVQYQGLTQGNLNLVPETADTTGLGFVVSPTFFPGFSASFDYYNINISNAIGSAAAQAIVDNCYLGNQSFCSAIIRGTNAAGGTVIQTIRIVPFNLVTQINRGYDIEASYSMRLDNIVSSWDGDISLRFLATHYMKNYSNDGITPATNTAGSNGAGPPSWVYNATLAYSADPFSGTLTARGISSGTLANNFIQCTSGCPASTVANPTINSNYMAGALYWDASIRYKIGDGGHTEAFLTVANLMNKNPPPYSTGPGGLVYTSISANATLYDTIGRTFRAGLRFKM